MNHVLIVDNDTNKEILSLFLLSDRSNVFYQLTKKVIMKKDV